MRFISLIHQQKIQVLLGQAAYSGGSLVVTLLMARLLETPAFGAFSSLVLAIYLMVSALNALVVQPLQVNLSRLPDHRSYLSFATWAQGVLMCVLLPVIAYFFPEGWVYAGGFLLYDYIRKVLLAHGSTGYALATDVLAMLVQVLFLVYCLWAGSGAVLTLTGLGWCWLPAVGLGVFYLRPGRVKRSDLALYTRLHYQQGRWMLLTAVAQWWSGNLFVVASGVLISVEALGAFRLAQSLFGVLNMVLQGFENYVLPEITRLHQQSTLVSTQYLRGISTKAAFVFGPILAVLMFFSQEVMVLAAGPSYAEYGYVVQGLTLLYAVIFIGYPVRMAIRVLLLNQHFFIGYLLSLGFAAVSFQYLLEHWQLAGAVAGLIFSQLIVLGYWQFILYKKGFVLWKLSI